MNDRTIVYQSYYNPIEANIVCSKLQDSGFPCFLADENISTIQPLYNQAVGGVKLIVFERDKAAIDLMLLEENDLEGDENAISDENTTGNEEIICERCASHNVAFGQATKERFSLWVLFVSILFLVYPFKAKKCFHCYDCGYEFH